MRLSLNRVLLEADFRRWRWLDLVASFIYFFFEHYVQSVRHFELRSLRSASSIGVFLPNIFSVFLTSIKALSDVLFRKLRNFLDVIHHAWLAASRILETQPEPVVLIKRLVATFRVHADLHGFEIYRDLVILVSVTWWTRILFPERLHTFIFLLYRVADIETVVTTYAYAFFYLACGERAYLLWLVRVHRFAHGACNFGHLRSSALRWFLRDQGVISYDRLTVHRHISTRWWLTSANAIHRTVLTTAALIDRLKLFQYLLIEMPRGESLIHLVVKFVNKRWLRCTRRKLLAASLTFQVLLHELQLSIAQLPLI